MPLYSNLLHQNDRVNPVGKKNNVSAVVEFPPIFYFAVSPQFFRLLKKRQECHNFMDVTGAKNIRNERPGRLDTIFITTVGSREDVLERILQRGISRNKVVML